MNNKNAPKTLTGSTPEEKLGSLGLMPGKQVDIRNLGALANMYGIEIMLFFEEDLARTRTLESVMEEYRSVSEYERPFIAVGSFLAFTRENDPSFEQTIQEFPLMIEIVSYGERPSGPGNESVLFVTGLMPFLDELDVDAPVPDPNG
ncbi:hypothetical protein [uncultured Methanoregula sp.]|uniref:hypothetical protein n=1 Tax=uncultured Methanoregula sp. TaxID=1005933 RepID=UPI002AAB70E6|nr:hypothetical protein [uncultured Methanoregula sp.]